MTQANDIPLAQLEQLSGARLFRTGNLAVLITPPGHGHAAAQLHMGRLRRAQSLEAAKIHLQVESGALEIGWLDANEALVAESVCGHTPSPAELIVRIPSGAAVSKLIF